MRLISFSMTLTAFRENRKTVTRRLGWEGLRAGEVLMAVDKAMGLKKGQKPKRLGMIEVVSVRRERLDAITDEDVALEGVEGVTTAEEFVRGFTRFSKTARPETLVTRIEFRRVLASVDLAAGIERDADGLPGRLFL